MTAGESLRTLRESLGLTIRDVENASSRIAAKYNNPDFAISLSRLSDVETKGITPSIFRMYSLAVIYRTDIRDLLAWYGVDVDQISADIKNAAPTASHKIDAMDSVRNVRIPVRLDPSFDTRTTANLGRMVLKWGLVPLSFLAQFETNSYTYGYVGTDDFTMYPLLLPGTFVQIDEARNKVVEHVWRSEYERPIYFVETREGMTCCWCELENDRLTLKPHPLSPVKTRVLRYGKEAEVIGQVVAVAMRLDEFLPPENAPGRKALPKSD